MIKKLNISKRRETCPICKTRCKRHSNKIRTLIDLDIHRPTKIKLTYGIYYCINCRKHFTIRNEIADPGFRYTKRVVSTAISLVINNHTYKDVKEILERRYHVTTSQSTIHDWSTRDLDRIKRLRSVM